MFIERKIAVFFDLGNQLFMVLLCNNWWATWTCGWA
jgi:hypothetical protein